MSEYQYYQWQAIDRLLTADELEEVQGLSSHMDVVTATEAVVTYQWGDFRHDPLDVLLDYFDAFLYMSNLCIRKLAFRFPDGSVAADAIDPYCVEDEITLTRRDGFWILDFVIENEAGDDWVGEEANLTAYAPLRQQIMDGDYRALYLAWLSAAERMMTLIEDSLEPAVPAGLQHLDPSQEAFADDLLRLDARLLRVAAKASGPLQHPEEQDVAKALALLTAEESRTFLRRVFNGEPGVRAALRSRLLALMGGKSESAAPTRTAGELLAAAHRLAEQEERQRQDAAARARIVRLENLAAREDEAWHEVEALIERKQTQAYDLAVHLLVSLHELAEYRGIAGQFRARVSDIRATYARRPALLERLNQAGW